jgi:molecular chaperone GrpE
MSDMEQASDAPSSEGNEQELPESGEPPSPPADEAALEASAAQAAEDQGPATNHEHEEAPPPSQHEIFVLGGADKVLDAVSALADQLVGRLDALQSKLERELRAEATRERVVDRLHAELQEYKQDLLLKVQRPIFIDLIQLHDDIGKMIDARPVVESAGQDLAPARGVLESIQTAIEDILYRQGVEPFMSDGDDFDPRKQRAISTVPADDPALNKKVAARLRKGFQSGERLVRPEIVTVYTLRPSRAPASE